MRVKRRLGKTAYIEHARKMRHEAGYMVVRNQTSEQPAKLRLDGYDTILLDAHGVFLTDYQNLRKPPGFNYGECQLLDKVEILFKLVS